MFAQSHRLRITVYGVVPDGEKTHEGDLGDRID
jgi:hypothetical protein